MAVLKGKYKSLAPRASFLSDVVVLAQAWKKAHNYVRRHNWYQNSLELDCSAVQLDSLLSLWATSLKDGTYRPATLRMVPAPKNAMWEFGPGWHPKESDPSKQILRPLAHLEIRDQTISTAAMLCLADCIETAQGNPAISEPENAREAGVYSYGNRLYCSWDSSSAGSRAHFSWGNTNVYSRYYQDYQKFVSRPVAIARNYQQSTSGSSVYVVKLDISAFYDNIEIPALIKGLRREYTSFRGKHPGIPAPDQQFWTMLASVFAFEWNAGDAAHSTLLRDGVLPGGLPQGMVSSGFFANAYLLEFDRAIGKSVRKRSQIGSGRKISIQDYCRYVDDLRIVVAVPEDTLLEQEIAFAVTNWIQRRLDQYVGGKSKLRVNAEKTEVERYSDLGGRSGVAARMKSLQKELSGPFDFNSLSQIEAGLHGLLAQAELGLQAKPLESVDDDMRPLGLIAAPKLEVRDDTLTRFSAYRLTRALRLRRGMTDLSEETNEGLAKDALSHEFEVAARRLVAAWSVNPSLVQVLLYALDLFPSPELLSPVLQALLSKLSPNVSGYERNVALYVLSEVLRAGATETGRVSENDIGFAVGRLDEYRAELCEVADRLLQSDGIPWYVKQQATLLLSACQRRSVASDEAELALHVILSDFVDGSYRTRTIGHSEAISIALVGHQILHDPRHFSKWFRSYAKQATRAEVAAAFETIGQTNSGLLATITKIGKGAEAA